MMVEKKLACRNPECQYEQPFSDANFCERCGTRIKNLCQAQVIDERGFKQVCATLNSNDAHYCRKCGNSLEGNFPKGYFERKSIGAQ